MKLNFMHGVFFGMIRRNVVDMGTFVFSHLFRHMCITEVCGGIDVIFWCNWVYFNKKTQLSIPWVRIFGV